MPDPIQTLLSYFKYEHLPQTLQQFSEPFHTLAHEIDQMLPDCEEKKMALRKLLEAKDCAVRTAVQWKEER